ncbi:hypothetical protein BO71DRAFT_399606 [Aspergillus ellipticus CBS 707.79]|uniref:Uncharacterized protein n=1 Tax=Aspergillus ellipticus CBS 707.79 TaxID=1448320 RepID=A0A319DZH4_9EURO|nr:hypothetical protein BO71DRAFT_399606 [Aspergillus ellipticus CBS 707.79]
MSAEFGPVSPSGEHHEAQVGTADGPAVNNSVLSHEVSENQEVVAFNQSVRSPASAHFSVASPSNEHYDESHIQVAGESTRPLSPVSPPEVDDRYIAFHPEASPVSPEIAPPEPVSPTELHTAQLHDEHAVASTETPTANPFLSENPHEESQIHDPFTLSSRSSTESDFSLPSHREPDSEKQREPTLPAISPSQANTYMAFSPSIRSPAPAESSRPTEDPFSSPADEGETRASGPSYVAFSPTVRSPTAPSMASPQYPHDGNPPPREFSPYRPNHF